MTAEKNDERIVQLMKEYEKIFQMIKLRDKQIFEKRLALPAGKPNDYHQNIEIQKNNLGENIIQNGQVQEILYPDNEIKKVEIPINTKKPKKILIATSITPNRIETQKLAINTWLNYGFHVVSLNTKEEVDILQPHFPHIHFHVVERSAKERYGKPYIYIYDFMRYLNSTDFNIVGIVNSDIHFKGVKGDFIDFIYEEASDSLVYGHRTEVNNLDDHYGTTSNGVDYFFFHKSFISIYKDEGLCMGQPAWDWWMVCVAAAENKPTKRMLSKIAFHQIHPQEWYESLNQYLIESIVFKKYLQKMYPSATKTELNSKMWEIVISKNGIEYPNEVYEDIIDFKPLISRPKSGKSILVATSIGPNRIDIQKRAIRTWVESGLDVVSLNTVEEIEKLKPNFPEIMFHKAERSAKEKYGKPYIYIYDLMQYLKNTNYTVVGIINSDIHFKNVKPDFFNAIYDHAIDSLVYGHRIDVNNINDYFGTISNGVDYFFFNKNLIEIYEDDGLCMGQPAWDWWMVCLPASKHQTTKRILTPIGYHEIHPQQWDENLNQYLINSIVKEKYLKRLYPGLNFDELNTKMWEIVISKSGIEM